MGGRRDEGGFVRRGLGDGFALLRSPPPLLIILGLAFAVGGVLAGLLGAPWWVAVAGVLGPSVVVLALSVARFVKQRDEARARVKALEGARVTPPTLAMLPVLFARSEWLVRVTVTNGATVRGSYALQVTALDGVPWYGPEPPWFVRWRNQHPVEDHELRPGDYEFLEVARLGGIDTTRTDIEPARWSPDMVFPVLIGGVSSDEPVRLGDVGSRADLPYEVVVYLRVWHRDGEHDQSWDHRLRITLTDTGTEMTPVASLEPVRSRGPSSDP